MLFIFPPSDDRPTEWRQISIVSSNSDSVDGEEQEERNRRLDHNANRATQRENEVTLWQAEDNLDTAEGCHPRVA